MTGLAAMAFVFIAVVNFVEAVTFPNYIYSHFGLAPQWLNAGFGLGVVLLVLKVRRLHPSFFFAAVVAVAAWIIAAAVPEVAGKTLARVALTTSRFTWTVGQKNRAVWGPRADFFDWVKTTTPDSASLLLPLETLPWRYTGNSQFMGAWLYSKKVLTTTRKNYQKIFNRYDFLLISAEADGAPGHLWPDFPIPAQKIIIYDWQANRGVTYENRDWDPAEWQDQEPWGLIVPKKI